MPPYRIVLYLIVTIFSSSKSDKPRKISLNGKHLTVLSDVEFPPSIIWKRNSSNDTVHVEGILMNHLKALQKMFNFSYSLKTEIPLPATEKSRRLLGSPYTYDYFTNGVVDYFLTAATPTQARFKIIDFPASWLETKFICLIPYPNQQLNIAASFKPLSYQVWIAFVTAAVATILCLRFIAHQNSVTTKRSDVIRGFTQCNVDVKLIASFVLGNMVSQGQRCYSTRLVVYIAAGAWCIGCFFLVQIYSSTLTSHLTSPNQKPIVNSINELARSRNVSTRVDGGLALATIFNNAASGNLKLFGDKIREKPGLLCNVTTDCLKSVQEGFAAYCGPGSSRTYVYNDLKKTGSCRYFIMKDELTTSSIYSPLRKGSPYMEIISIGTLRLKEAGLYNQWLSWYIPTPWQCMELNRRDSVVQRLTIKNMTSIFAIMLYLLPVSVLFFILEILTHFISKNLVK